MALHQKTTSSRAPGSLRGLFGHFLKEFPKVWFKRLPLLILLALGTWFVHTYLMVVFNDGSGGGTTIVSDLLAARRGLLQGVLVWTLLAGMATALLGRVRQEGAGQVLSGIRSTPSRISSSYRETGMLGMPFGMAGLAGAFLIVAFAGNRVASLLLAFLCILILSTGGRSFFYYIMRLGWEDWQRWRGWSSHTPFQLTAGQVVLGGAMAGFLFLAIFPLSFRGIGRTFLMVISLLLAGGTVVVLRSRWADEAPRLWKSPPAAPTGAAAGQPINSAERSRASQEGTAPPPSGAVIEKITPDIAGTGEEDTSLKAADAKPPEVIPMPAPRAIPLAGPGADYVPVQKPLQEPMAESEPATAGEDNAQADVGGAARAVRGSAGPATVLRDEQAWAYLARLGVVERVPTPAGPRWRALEPLRPGGAIRQVAYRHDAESGLMAPDIVLHVDPDAADVLPEVPPVVLRGRDALELLIKSDLAEPVRTDKGWRLRLKPKPLEETPLRGLAFRRDPDTGLVEPKLAVLVTRTKEDEE